MAMICLFDTSATMSRQISPNDPTTIMDALKEAAIGVFRGIESGKWTVGLITYQDNADVLTWGLDLLTDNNRTNFLNTIRTLTSVGESSDLGTALMNASVTLLTQARDLPKVVVIFTDGGICHSYPPPPRGELGPDCQQKVDNANILKRAGIDIVTISMGLSDNNQDFEYLTTLNGMASPDPLTGQPLSFNLSTSEELREIFRTKVASYCNFLDIGLSVRMTPQRISRGETMKFGFMVRHNWGPEMDIRIEADGQEFLMSGGSISLDPSVGTISAESPRLVGKGFLEVNPNMATGIYNLKIKLLPSDGDEPLATRTFEIEIVNYDVDLSFETLPTYDPVTKTISGWARIEVTEGNIPEKVGAVLDVVHADDNISAKDVIADPFNIHNYKFVLNPQTPKRHYYSFLCTDNFIDGDYKVHLVVKGLSVHIYREFFSEELSIP